MKKRIHPKTQAAINKYAAGLLKTYREKRKHNIPSYARFYARMKMHNTVSGNVYVEIVGREFSRYRFKLS